MYNETHDESADDWGASGAEMGPGNDARERLEELIAQEFVGVEINEMRVLAGIVERRAQAMSRAAKDLLAEAAILKAASDRLYERAVRAAINSERHAEEHGSSLRRPE